MVTDNIYMDCDLTIEECDVRTGKPYLRLKFPAGSNNQVVIALTLNVAEMIGGAATGARKRWEDQHPLTRMPGDPRRT